MLLALAVALANRRTTHTGPALSSTDLTVLVVTCLICTTVYGLALFLLPTVESWAVALIAGVLVYMAAAAWLIAGVPATLAFCVFAAAAVVYYVRQRMLAVPEGHVAVTTLAGSYLRGVLAGTTVLLPGERVAATVETGERQYTCPRKQARVRDADGTPYIARAAATVGYHLLPSQAHLAALSSDDWERDLHDVTGTTLREALAEWARTMLDDEAASPDRLLARTMLRLLREQARVRGIHILWVGVKQIWLMPESETIPADLADDEDEDEEHMPDAAPRVDATRTAGGTTPGSAPSAPTTAHGEVPSAPGVAGALPAIEDVRAQDTPPPIPLPPEALAPEALADAYEAVREGRVTDPATIRDIAQAFLRVAADEQRNEEFPFDAVGAARILMDRAVTVERERRVVGWRPS